jgi:metal-responsive CopG/Arc/MetJ family transcriptional regulator
MGRRKLTEVKQVRSVYMPKEKWDKTERLAKENGFKSRNKFIEKAIDSYLSSKQLREAGI